MAAVGHTYSTNSNRIANTVSTTGVSLFVGAPFRARLKNLVVVLMVGKPGQGGVIIIISFVIADETDHRTGDRHRVLSRAQEGAPTSAALVPLSIILYHPGVGLAVVGLLGGVVGLVVCRRRGWRWATAGLTAGALAFSSGGVYYLLMAPGEAQAGVADYAENKTYFYTLDHIGKSGDTIRVFMVWTPFWVFPL